SGSFTVFPVLRSEGLEVDGQANRRVGGADSYRRQGRPIRYLWFVPMKLDQISSLNICREAPCRSLHRHAKPEEDGKGAGVDIERSRRELAPRTCTACIAPILDEAKSFVVSVTCGFYCKRGGW